MKCAPPANGGTCHKRSVAARPSHSTYRCELFEVVGAVGGSALGAVGLQVVRLNCGLDNQVLVECDDRAVPLVQDTQEARRATISAPRRTWCLAPVRARWQSRPSARRVAAHCGDSEPRTDGAASRRAMRALARTGNRVRTCAQPRAFRRPPGYLVGTIAEFVCRGE